MIEHHPAMHYALVLVFYHLGLMMNVLAGAHIATQSKINGVRSIGGYFALRWIPLSIRWFLCVCLFFIVWENPALLNLERFMPNFAAHVGVSGLLGWASDSVWDKVLAILLPGVQKELPAVPGESP